MGDIWKSGGQNNNNVCREVSKRCVDIKRQKMKANMRDKTSLVLCNKLKTGKKKVRRCLHIGERRGIGSWKMDTWR
jgi:hypothetical protein